MIIYQDPKTGYWDQQKVTRDDSEETLVPAFDIHHSETECVGAEFCDIHNRRPLYEQNLLLNWRDDRGMMEVLCEKHNVGHPTTAQKNYWIQNLPPQEAIGLMIHACCGCLP